MKQSGWVPAAQVGRYTLLAKIATGGMAEIWLADQSGPQGFKKLVVIKRILESFSQNSEFVTMFLDEARIAAQLNHPNIVQIFDLGEHASTLYIAMEYLPGETLASVVRTATNQRQPLPFELSARMLSDAAAGLGHAHAKRDGEGTHLGIVHRDVSPQNLMVTVDGNTKVVDFGVARAANRATQTIDGHIKGKVAYMSPEQAAAGHVDARSDVFSLGVILFEAVTRTRFYETRELTQMVTQLCGALPLPKANERNPEVPAGLAQIIDTAIERDPARRYANGLELQEALDEWLHHLPHKVGVGAVASWLSVLFADRWGKNLELVESARKGLLTPSGLRKNLAQESDGTMPGHTPSMSMATPGPFPHLRLPAKAALAFFGMVLLVLGVAWGLKVQAERVPAVEPVKAALAPAPAPLAPSVLIVDTEPVGAAVEVDGVSRGPSPLEVTGLPAGSHTVRVSLDGYRTDDRTVTLRGDGDRLQVPVTLAAVDPPPAPPPPAVPPAAVPPAAVPPAAVPPAVVPPPRKATRVPAPARGKLTLQTEPLTEVFLGGNSLGETPLIDVGLPAGRHRLKLVNAGERINTVVEIEIAAGKTTLKKMTLAR